MKFIQVIFFLIIGVFAFLIIKMISSGQNVFYNNPYSTTPLSTQGGNTIGGILQSVGNTFFGLWDRGVFGSGSSSSGGGDSGTTSGSTPPPDFGSGDIFL